jgi:hypothetical protein
MHGLKSAILILNCSLVWLWSASAMLAQYKPRRAQGQDTCPQQRFGKFSEWSAPVNLGQVNSNSDDYHPAISNNGLSLYITSNRPGGISSIEDIWVSRRTSLDAPWGEPQNLGPNINSEGGTCCPNLSPDQHWLFFSGNRPGGCPTGGAGYDLWVSHREGTLDDFAWDPPVNLGCQIYPATGIGACAPTYFEDNETGLKSVYFCRDSGGLGDYDIYVSTLRPDGLFSRAALAWELSGPFRDTRTAIRRDGLEMFITSNRTGGLGGNDVWVSTRETTLDAWSTPVNPGRPLNSEFADGGPALSCDGATLYFFSDRPGGYGGRDLYVTTRKKLCDDDDNHACDGN